MWAYQVQDRYLSDKAKGRIFHGVPNDVFKAQVITSTTLRPWDRTWMRDSRELWYSIRKFTTLDVETLAKRIGISASSITRYSAGSRTPNTGDFGLICVAMWKAMQDRLWQLDMWLCLEDYAAAQTLGVEGADLLFNNDRPLLHFIDQFQANYPKSYDRPCKAAYEVASTNPQN